jgi:hypothetical protein
MRISALPSITLLPPVGRVKNSLEGIADGSHVPFAMVASVQPPAISDVRRTWSTCGPSSFSANPRTDCMPPA